MPTVQRLLQTPWTCRSNYTRKCEVESRRLTRQQRFPRMASFITGALSKASSMLCTAAGPSQTSRAQSMKPLRSIPGVPVRHDITPAWLSAGGSCRTNQQLRSAVLRPPDPLDLHTCQPISADPVCCCFSASRSVHLDMATACTVQIKYCTLFPVSLHDEHIQWSEDMIKADPFFGRSRVQFRVPPWVSNTIARDHLA